MERVQAQIAEYGFTDRVHVVEGGDNRQESVAHALAALPAEPTTSFWSTTPSAR